MDQEAAVARLLVETGWVAGFRQLRRVASRTTIERMVAGGRLVRVARGVYAAPVELPARLAAERVRGVAAYRTAALHYGWAMTWQPARPCVTVPRGRVVGDRGAGLDLSWRDLPPEDVADGWITTALRTVLDCAATLPFDAALAIADSALRARAVTPKELSARAGSWPLRGRARVQRVAAAADGRSSGPIESVLRAICLEIPGLSVVPQVAIHRAGRRIGIVDLADEGLQIAIEAEGFAFHGGPDAFAADCWRYDELVAAGWLVLRFTWEHVTRRPGWVREVVLAAVAHRRVALARTRHTVA